MDSPRFTVMEYHLERFLAHAQKVVTDPIALESIERRLDNLNTFLEYVKVNQPNGGSHV